VYAVDAFASALARNRVPNDTPLRTETQRRHKAAAIRDPARADHRERRYGGHDCRQQYR
jgi:hypothetical protein